MRHTRPEAVFDPVIEDEEEPKLRHAKAPHGRHIRDVAEPIRPVAAPALEPVEEPAAFVRPPVAQPVLKAQPSAPKPVVAQPAVPKHVAWAVLDSRVDTYRRPELSNHRHLYIARHLAFVDDLPAKPAQPVLSLLPAVIEREATLSYEPSRLSPLARIQGWWEQPTATVRTSISQRVAAGRIVAVASLALVVGVASFPGSPVFASNAVTASAPVTTAVSADARNAALQEASRSFVRSAVETPSTAAPETTTTTEAPTTTTAAPKPTTTVAPKKVPATVPTSTSSCSKSKAAAKDCWWGLISQYDWNDQYAFNVMWCESTGNPNAKNAHSTATGLFQILNGPKDPEANVRLAYQMYSNRGWQPWVCKG